MITASASLQSQAFPCANIPLNGHRVRRQVDQDDSHLLVADETTAAAATNRHHQGKLACAFTSVLRHRTA